MKWLKGILQNKQYFLGKSHIFDSNEVCVVKLRIIPHLITIENMIFAPHLFLYRIFLKTKKSEKARKQQYGDPWAWRWSHQSCASACKQGNYAQTKTEKMGACDEGCPACWPALVKRAGKTCEQTRRIVWCRSNQRAVQTITAFVELQKIKAWGCSGEELVDKQDDWRRTV